MQRRGMKSVVQQFGAKDLQVGFGVRSEPRYRFGQLFAGLAAVQDVVSRTVQFFGGCDGYKQVFHPDRSSSVWHRTSCDRYRFGSSAGISPSTQGVGCVTRQRYAEYSLINETASDPMELCYSFSSHLLVVDK